MSFLAYNLYPSLFASGDFQATGIRFNIGLMVNRLKKLYKYRYDITQNQAGFQTIVHSCTRSHDVHLLQTKICCCQSESTVEKLHRIGYIRMSRNSFK
jgi:hypothetical protein